MKRMASILLFFLAACSTSVSSRIFTFPGEVPRSAICERFGHCFMHAAAKDNHWNIYFYDLKKCTRESHLMAETNATIKELKDARGKLKELLK